MKERPILFSTPMVQAILAGRKTMTRRVVKPQFRNLWGQGVKRGDDFFSAHVDIAEPDGSWKWLRCPYGMAGDRLWVREKWGFIDFESSQEFNAAESAIAYWASGELIPMINRWRSPIHMPRAFSRITLEIVGVKVERLQEISEEDAKAEGVSPDMDDESHDSLHADYDGMTQHTRAFERLWNAIHGPGSWAANLWVWCISFKRIGEPK